MNELYSVFGDYPLGLPVLATDCRVDVVFEKGEPCQTLGNFNGWLSEVNTNSNPAIEGVLEAGASNVGEALVTCHVGTGDVHIGTPVFFVDGTNVLSTNSGAAGAHMFGKVVRVSYDEVFPVIAADQEVTLGIKVTNY